VFIGVVTAYVGVSLTLGGAAAARPIFQLLAIGWTLVLAAWAGRVFCKLEHKRLPDSWRSNLCGRIELIAFNVVLTLVLAELALRAIAVFGGPSLVISDALGAHLLKPGHDYGDGLRGNRLGFPGPDFVKGKAPGVFRIAALGDSFAVGPAVPFVDNYLTLLGSRLPRAEIYNFGVSGAGPREYRVILRQCAWGYQPDLVLLSVFVGNDITESLATPRHMDPRQLALYLLVTRGWRLALEKARQEPRDSPVGSKRRAAAPLSAETFREVEGRRLAVCLRFSRQSLEKKWRRALADLDCIVADCRRQGTPLAVVLIPDEFQVNPEVLRLAMREAGVERDQVALDLPQRRLTRFFEERGVSCLDLLPAFKNRPDTYAPRDTHWNVAGNKLAADSIAAWLRRLIK
jgi:hypothetical protein